MKRTDAPELLDSDGCSRIDAQAALRVLDRVNRWFGGVTTTQKMIQNAAQALGATRLSLLEVAAGTGELPAIVRKRLALRGTTLDITLLDRARSHLPSGVGDSENLTRKTNAVVADALAIPFADHTFDLVSCSLFAHHLNQRELVAFVREGLRVSRRALLINDLVRHPFHLSLVYASYPLMRNRIAWLDGLTSVRRAYVPQEVRSVIQSAFPVSADVQVEVLRNYLFRMGVTVWKSRQKLADNQNFPNVVARQEKFYRSEVAE